MMIQTTIDNPHSSASKRRVSGFTLVEVMISVAVITLVGSSVIGALVFNERFAAQARLMTNARAIVQRNIELAQGVRWTKAMALSTGDANTPAVLKITSGTTWDDDAGGDNAENIAVLRNTNSVLVSGTLTRIVQSANTDSTVRRVTFSLSYQYRGVGPGRDPKANFIFSASTMRSTDD